MNDWLLCSDQTVGVNNCFWINNNYLLNKQIWRNSTAQQLFILLIFSKLNTRIRNGALETIRAVCAALLLHFLFVLCLHTDEAPLSFWHIHHSRWNIGKVSTQQIEGRATVGRCGPGGGTLADKSRSSNNLIWVISLLQWFKLDNRPTEVLDTRVPLLHKM